MLLTDVRGGWIKTEYRLFLRRGGGGRGLKLNTGCFCAGGGGEGGED